MVSKRLALLAISLFLLTPAPIVADQHESAGPGSETTETTVEVGVAPVWLRIPAIGVDADVVPVGTDDDGAMSAPRDPDTVAWWSLGYGTGVPGNVVLAAHIDWGGRLRVFGRLRQLQPGDQIVVVDEALREFIYEVAWSEWVDAEGAAIAEIFGSAGGSELTLITCGGRYISANRQYLDRLIVRAELI